MAEKVFNNSTLITKEIQEMRETGLYSIEETKIIIRKVKDFEYKINGVTKSLDDFYGYITFLKALVKQISLRRDKKQTGEKKNAIEFNILRRIKNVYELGIQRFTNDVAVRQSYLNFCTQSNFTADASLIVDNMVKAFPHDEKVWQIAANWHANERKDHNLALKVLHRGLTLNKDSELLYSQAIRITVHALNDDSLKQEERKLLMTELDTYIELACSNIMDYNYFINLLAQLKVYDFAAGALSTVIEKMKRDFKARDIVWHTLAQRELEKLSDCSDSRVSSSTGPSRQDVYEKCSAIYEEGLQNIPHNVKKSLWSLYLRCLFDLHNEDNDDSKTFLTTRLIDCLSRASKEKNLHEKYYINWLQLLTDDEVSDILEEGTENSPDSLELWKLRLRYAILSDDTKHINEIFKKGVCSLGSKALPLWLMTLRFYMLMNSQKIVKAIFIDGMKQPVPICQELKPRYVEWLAMTKGIDEARAKYADLAKAMPYCKDLHSVMAKLEASEMVYDVEKWKNVHELACEQFGSKDVDVWINYILLYLNFNKAVDPDSEVEKICRRAESKLNPLLLSEFREKYLQALERRRLMED